jgi:hypothetical protein
MQRETTEGKPPTEFNGYEIGATIGLWKHAEEDYSRLPEPSAQDRDKLLADIRGKLRYKLRDAILDIGQQMPHRPGGPSCDSRRA